MRPECEEPLPGAILADPSRPFPRRRQSSHNLVDRRAGRAAPPPRVLDQPGQTGLVPLSPEGHAETRLY